MYGMLLSCSAVCKCAYFFQRVAGQNSHISSLVLLHLNRDEGEKQGKRVNKTLSQVTQTNLEDCLCCILKKNNKMVLGFFPLNKEVFEGPQYFANVMTHAFRQQLSTYSHFSTWGN